MNKIRKFDKFSAVMVAEAGCVLENLEKEANDNGLMVPLDLGSKGRLVILESSV